MLKYFFTFVKNQFMPYQNEHAARIINPSEFQQNSFRRINIKTGIDAIIGKLKGKSTTTTQAYRFDKKVYTVEQAKKWLKDNKIKYISFEPAVKGNAMANKILTFFAPIYRSTVEAFIEKMLEVDSEDDIEIWMNTPGGGVFAGWGMIGALNERKGKNNVKVFGDASSMGLFALLFMDKVEAIDVSNFTLHRADGYASTEEEKQYLESINKQIRAKLEKRIDQEALKRVTGKTLNDVFNPETRLNVNLTAKQAKEIGLVDKIIRLEPKQLKAYNEKYVAFAEFEPEGLGEEMRGSIEQIQLQNNQIKKGKMTREEFKAEHPEIYNDIIQAGIDQERDRIEAFLVFAEIDIKAVKKGIEEGKNPTHKFYAEMNLKANSVKKLEDIKADSQEGIDTLKNEKKENITAEEKAEIEAAKKAMFEAAGIKEEDK